MKRILIAASCLALVLPTFSIAQMNPGQMTRPAPGQGDRPGGGNGSNPGRPGGGGNRPNPGAPGGGGGNRPNPGGPGGGNRPNPGAPNRPAPGIPNRPNPGVPNRPNPGVPNRPGHRPGHGHHYRPGRPGILPIGPGFGWNGHRYRGGAFRYPPGYAYRRWVRGQTLPILFLSAAYYFTNYAVLGLDPPPYGYQWVRYGNDILLVNIRTGEVMDVEYNVFY